MTEQLLRPFPRRKVPGHGGGKPVNREFHFAPRDGEKYPSESTVIRERRLPDDPNKSPSWMWAMHYAAEHDVWLVVPIRGNDEESRRQEKGWVRGSIWRTGKRNGFELTSQYVYPNLYVKVTR